MYLNLKTKIRASPWSDAPERVPFTLKFSAELGSSINREPVHIARVVFAFQAIDDTEIIGYCPRDFSFVSLQNLKGKRLFQHEYFITFLLPAGGVGRIAFVSLACTHLPCYRKDENQLKFREVLQKEICGFKICTQTYCYYFFFYIRFIVPVILKTTENLTIMIRVLARQKLYQHLKFY